MREIGNGTRWIPVLAIAALTAQTTAVADLLSITARNDRPGPVDIRVDAKDQQGGTLLSATLSWTADDNSWSSETLTIPGTTSALRFTFTNDYYVCCDPDTDRQAEIDFFDIDGKVWEGEDFDLTGGPDPQFPGCAVILLDGRTVADCGNQGDWVEYDFRPFFKAGYPNYAPSGIPDFDQRQDKWAGNVRCGLNLTPDSTPAGDDALLPLTPPCASADTPIIDKGANGILETALAGDDFYGTYEFCVPTAAANCLWWFDSRSADPGQTACDGNDSYDLVTAYPVSSDDHCAPNVDDPTTPPGGVPPDSNAAFGELIEDLAWRMNTNGQRTGPARSGTTVADLEAAVEEYFAEKGPADEYIVNLIPLPDLDFIDQELRRSQDLILILSFVQNCTGPQFLGGHAVTTAGVHNSPSRQEICISDPFLDLAEGGSTGRVLPGPHAHSGLPETVHNDAALVSHDCYPVQASAPPFGAIGLPHYGNVVPEIGDPELTDCADIENFLGQNVWDPNDPIYELPDDPPCDPGCPVETVVSYVLEISPFFWKAGVWNDYASSGMPDFDQKQGGFTCPLDGTWSHCGPAAVANSLWWFDSAFEDPNSPPPPALSDTYPLLQPLGSFDDHDAQNVQPVVAQLAQKMNTDDQTAGWTPARGGFCGTYIEDMETGVKQHLADVGLATEFFTRVVRYPTFEFVATEVERSQDMVLLLGFWQLQDLGGGPVWVRIGGHYVTVAGVDRDNGLIAISDPFLDAAEGGTTPGRVLGSVPHVHTGPPETSHNDARNVAHDLYDVVPTTSPGGIWGLKDYAVALGAGVSNFVLQNTSDQLEAEEPPTGPPFGPEPIVTEVEYALDVSPCPPEDADGDGYRALCPDCDDGNPYIHPGAPEICNDVDTNCDEILPVDQETDPTEAMIHWAGVSSGRELSQTFTVGRSGNLSQVDMLVRRNTPGGNLVVDIRATSGGAPVEPNGGLAEVSIPLADIRTTPGFMSIDFSSFSLPVTAGDVLAVAARVPSGAGTLQWIGSYTNPYAAGGVFVRNASNPTWTPGGGVDLGLRVYIDCAPTASGLNVTPTSLTWAPLSGGTVLYDLIRGELAPLRGPGGFQTATKQCLANDHPSNVYPYTAAPPLGQGYWFLVRRVASGINDSYDGYGTGQVAGRDGGIALSGLDCP